MTSIEKELNDRLGNVEQANGIGDRQPTKGIAQRLDAIEDKQTELEDRIEELESA